MTVADRPDLVVIDSGLPCDTFNFVCRARLAPLAAADRAGETVAYFRRVDRPFSWWVGPADTPAELPGVLRAAGLEPAEAELAMAADLAQLRDDDAPPPGLRIERVASERTLREFAAVSAANWTPPDAEVIRFYERVSSALLSSECPLWLYLGLFDGRAVATAEMTVAGGVVGLYNISTVEAYRRRGFGTALTLRPLLDARRLGQRTAVLQAAPAGVGLYERVGFRPYGDFTEYKPAAPSG